MRAQSSAVADARMEAKGMRNRALATLTAALALLVVTAAGARAETLPVEYDSAIGFAHASPTAAPPGANNFTCRRTARHPLPVILVHGTFEDMADNWWALSPLLFDN